MGDDAKFADIALRWAAHWQRIERYSEAFYHYLEAEYAIKKRLKKSVFSEIRRYRRISRRLSMK